MNDQARPSRRRVPRWAYLVLGLLVVLGIGAVWAWNRELPYYAISPGPVQQVGSLIEIEGEGEVEVFPPNGDLYFLTVVPQQVNVYEYLEARLDPRVDVVDRERILPEGISQQELRQVNRNLMDESKKLAACVALRHLGYQAECDKGLGAEIIGFVDGSPADRVLRQGDVVVGVEEEPVGFAPEAAAIVADQKVGETITLTVLREGERREVEVTLVKSTEEPDQPMVGVFLQSLGVQIELPFEVHIDSKNVGGPSAGMMYALGIIDRLTEGSLAHDQVVAGTGTIRSDGTVGAIGGIRQKVFGARAAGAEYILVPDGNYREALTAAGEEVEIVSVEDLDDALAFLDTLGPS